MGAPEPRVVVLPPPGWVAAEPSFPPLASASGATIAGWSAWRSPAPSGGAQLVAGCVATPIPGWVEDMRPAVEARTVGLAGAQAANLLGSPGDLRAAGDGSFELRPASELAAPPVGRARTFIGFDSSRVFTCFAVCARRRREAAGEHEEGCDPAVLGARLEGSLAPPRPGLVLRGATWAVHHPQRAALGAFALVVLLGVIAVAARRRPRSTIARIGGRRANAEAD